jgi:hypothetical protein
MEINITQLLTTDVFDFSHSRDEGGQNAGQNTWRAALEETKSAPLLSTPDQLEALRDHVKGFGAWNQEEISAWNDNECNALFLQLVSGDLREMGFDSFDDMTAEYWTEYESDENSCHNIFRSESGELFYYLGN